MNRFHPFIPFLVLCLILTTSFFSGCSRKPLVPVCIDAVPSFTDDLDLDSLAHAVQEDLDYLRTQPPKKNITIAGQTIPLKRLIISLEHFLLILSSNPTSEKLDELIRQQYDVYQATGTKGFNPGRKMLITGYYQPVFEGSLSRKAPFLYPLYSPPDDLVPQKNGKTAPYWTRKEIETNNRAAGYELVWLKDPFDAFVLHVQGSGLVQLQNGTVRGVHYAAKNGQPYRSIGKYLVDNGKMTLEEANLATIRDYIATHPEERDKILHHNPSFIFFDWTETHGAIGNLGKELTAGRSIAVDQDCFPAGGLAFLVSRQPVSISKEKISWKPLQRFVVVQDKGSAIRGPGRVDLFWGSGSKAGFAAGRMKEKGRLYFLLLKDEMLNRIVQNN